MADLFEVLNKRVDANARRAVEVFARELPEYRTLASGERTHAALLDFAVELRRQTVRLASEDRPATGDYLALITSAGRERAESGVSLASHRLVLGLQSNLTLQEVHEAADPASLSALLRMLSWLGSQARPAQDAYTRGFVDGQRHSLPFTDRVQQLAAMMLADDPTVSAFARSLNIPLADHYAVTVIRIADETVQPTRTTREEVTEALIELDRTPMGWHDPLEFVALMPSESTDPVQPTDRDQERALALSCAFAALVDRPCAAGAATGPRPSLPAAHTLARQISHATPIGIDPYRVSTITDVFVELSTAQLPQVDRWLRRVAHQLFRGPDLVATLDAYYRHDMNRLTAAAHLHIHPRTLDYRLRRARDLTDIDPTTTRGVRVLSTAVGRILAGP
ncbi:PucR family transcriptional regulator [Actinomadura rubrisoli]|uniref:PucR family transcriptional regulator n=1 Tax=Actinomadura rubrisoli TaxID=2530368 RepID=A0A4R5BTA4_9ACTN|nr:helix-turn-helix domain-containing protein [Actinomadura rubrisoli]TDD89269.1 PucR family transcriptional regulator [Actinomadura rubrisoli]